MGAPTGNDFWTLRTEHGRKTAFTPKTLKLACDEYFSWCDSNPLMETQQSRAGKGTLKLEVSGEDISVQDSGLIELPKMRAYTWEGLELYLGIASLRLYKGEKGQAGHKGFAQVITRVTKIIYTQKFTGAAAGLLNPNIIARDLGLSDKQEVTGKDGKDLIPSSLSDAELLTRINKVSQSSRKG